jgi:hypothetical protein
VKKLFLSLLFLATLFITTQAQDSTGSRNRKLTKKEKKEEKRKRINAMIKQEEEGVLSYYKQNSFGVQLRTNGWGFFYELGKRKTPRFTNTYSIEFTEIKHPKEERLGGFFSNPFTYGKINSFYQLKLGYGQQYIFGQKGNKNGIAVIGMAQGGFSAGLIKPYYLNLGTREIKYSDDSLTFLSAGSSVEAAGAGPFKGWGEITVAPGVYFKSALRFDFGRYNEGVSAVEIGLSVDYYFKDIQMMAPQNKDRLASGPQRLFFQGHIAYIFGNRK